MVTDKHRTMKPKAKPRKPTLKEKVEFIEGLLYQNPHRRDMACYNKGVKDAVRRLKAIEEQDEKTESKN